MSNGIARDLPRTQMLLVKKYEKAGREGDTRALFQINDGLRKLRLIADRSVKAAKALTSSVKTAKHLPARCLKLGALNFDGVTIDEDHDVGRPSSGVSSSRQYLTAQTTTSEHILVQDGSTINKVVLTNHSGNGKDEKVEITEDAGKVLKEAEKARMSMQGHRIIW